MSDRLVDVVQLQRAEEQVRSFRPSEDDHKHDPWAIKGGTYAGKPPRKKPRTRCLAGDCDRRPVAFGYCRPHIGMVRTGSALDLEGVTSAAAAPGEGTR